MSANRSSVFSIQHFLKKVNSWSSIEKLDPYQKYIAKRDLRSLMLSDIKTKLRAEKVAGDLAALEILNSYFFAENEDLDIELSDLFKNEEQVKDLHCDVLFITVIEEELVGALAVFNIPYESRHQYSKMLDNGQYMYQTTIEGVDEISISIGIVLVGRARNVNCAVCTNKAISLSQPKLCVLSGIAGGVKGKVNLCDVVGVSSVWDIEGGAVLESGIVPEFEQVNLDEDSIFPKFAEFNPNRGSGSLNEEVLKVLEPNNTITDMVPDSYRRKAANKRLKYKKGSLIVGEKVIKDGKLPENVVQKMRDEVSRKIIAVEMEGVGFAKACISHKVPWMIFRGISDFGNNSKRDQLQMSAAISSAVVARKFIIDYIADF